MNELTPEHICQIMNEAFELDPVAIRAMLCSIMPVDKAFIDHPTISVEGATADAQKFTLTWLSLINGFMFTTGRLLASKWSEPDINGRCKMLGFTLADVEEVYPGMGESNE